MKRYSDFFCVIWLHHLAENLHLHQIVKEIPSDKMFYLKSNGTLNNIIQKILISV